MQRRAAARAAKSAPEVGPFMAALRAIDKAIEAAAANPEMRHALEAARAPLAEQLDAMGLQAPRKRVEAA